MAWSADGAFLATRSDAMAGAVWVWEAGSFGLAALLQHTSPVRELAWSPGGGPPQLAIVTGLSVLPPRCNLKGLSHKYINSRFLKCMSPILFLGFLLYL